MYFQGRVSLCNKIYILIDFYSQIQSYTFRYNDACVIQPHGEDCWTHLKTNGKQDTSIYLLCIQEVPLEAQRETEDHPQTPRMSFSRKGTGV